MSDDAVIAALVNVARPVILEEFNVDSCIASTRIGIDALNYFGVKAVELPLTLLVFNEEAAALVEAGKTLPEIYEITLKHGMEESGGPWTIGVGAEVAGSDGWAGHLVIAVPERRVLVDLSIDQICRPRKNIIFKEPVAIEIPSDEWWHDPTAITAMKSDDEHPVLLMFDRRGPDLEGYKRSMNWHRRSRGSRAVFENVTGRIIRLMKEELG